MLQKLRNVKIQHIIYTAIFCLLASVPLTSGSLDAATFRNVLVPFVLMAAASVFYKIKINKEYVCYLILWLAAIVSTLFSSHIGIERTVITYFLFALMVVLFANAGFTALDLHRFSKFYVCFALVCALLIIATRIANIPHVGTRYSVAILGIKKNPNYINPVILLGCAFELYWMVKQARGRIIRAILLAVMLYGCLLTGTRAALLTFILCVAFAGIYAFFASNAAKKLWNLVRTNKKSILVICLIAAVCVVGAVLIVPVVAKGRFSLDKLFNDSLRMEMWKMSFLEFLRNPILGLGLNGTTAYNTSLQFKVTNIHNVLLQFICDQGIIGVLIFGYILYRIIRRTKKEDRFLIGIMSLAMYFPILFQNGLVALTFWWPLLMLEVFSGVSKREGLQI